MTTQVFTPTPTSYDYDKERDLEVIHVAGKHIQDLLAVTAEEQEHQKNLVISEIFDGALYVNTIQVG